MLSNQFILPIASKLVIDLFAGGGGASTGIEQAIGRHVDIAVNHDPAAVSLHQANHPQTAHFVSDVFEVDPMAVTQGREVGLLWASPDCKHFSKAKGGKPVSKKIRGLAWVVVKWAKLVRPDVICLENVEEFQDWGPLTPDGMPCPINKGKTFRRWKAQLQNLGYKIEHRELRACDYGAPTIRKRLFLVARCDGQPIVWPQPTHAKAPAKGSGLKPWRTAAECIDWSIPCPSIFERERPLAEATQRRIAHGIKRYVLDSPRPFIVPVTHQGDNRAHDSREPLRTVTSAKRGELALTMPSIQKFRSGSVGSAIDEPLHTVTAGGEQARPGTGNAMGLMSATLVQTGYGERPGQAPRVPGLDKPLGTAVDGQKHGLVAAFLAKHYGGHEGPGIPADGPTSTVTTQDHHHLVAAHLVKHYSGEPQAGRTDASLETPAPTVMAQGAKHSLVTAQLVGVGGRQGQGQSPSYSPAQPARTVTAKGDTAVVTAHLIDAAHADVSPTGVKRWGAGHRDIEAPTQTVTGSGGNAALAASTLVKLRGTSNSASTAAPLGTVSAQGFHHAAVHAFMMRYFGVDQNPHIDGPLHTVTTKHRDAVVTVMVDGEPYVIADIGMRMLQPRELYRAQGFPDSYVIDRGADGRALTKAEQVRMCGNSVCPPLARAIVAANYSDDAVMRRAA